MGQGFAAFAIGVGTNLVLGRGKLFVDRLSTAGLLQGFKFAGNVTDFKLRATSEVKEMRSSVDPSNALLARVETQKTIEASMTLTEYIKEFLAIMQLGDVATYTQTNTPIVGESLSASVLTGRVYFTAKRTVGSYTVKSNAAARTEDVDYNIDTATGAIYVIPGGAIVNGHTLTIDYTPATISALDQINIGTAAPIKARIRFVGDPLNGKIHEVLLPLTHLQPDGDLGLIGDDFANFGLKATGLADSVNFPATPFGFWFQR